MHPFIDPDPPLNRLQVSLTILLSFPFSFFVHFLIPPLLSIIVYIDAHFSFIPLISCFLHSNSTFLILFCCLSSNISCCLTIFIPFLLLSCIPFSQFFLHLSIFPSLFLSLVFLFLNPPPTFSFLFSILLSYFCLPLSLCVNLTQNIYA